MNGIQLNGKPRRSDKPVPGCLGRMVNLFDLTSSRNLLTNKPHNNDGLSLSRSLSDVSTMSDLPRKEMQDKAMISEIRRSSSGKKHDGTPVKMLMAEEMSNDLKSSQNSPNVVARLMGLDALPEQQPNINSEKQVQHWKGEHVCHNDHIVCENHSNSVKSGNIRERWKPSSQRTTGIKNDTRQKGSSIEFVNEKLALIHQKFTEAKQFTTDENLRQTREFQDALDVWSSKGNLFLEALHEPKSFSENIYGGRSIPSPPETKRITVLRPSKVMVDEKYAGPVRRNDEHRRKQTQVHLCDAHNKFSPTMSTLKGDDSFPQPARIVVLKPSALRVNDIFHEETEDEEAQEAREVAKEITQIHENLAGHWRDETFLSSVYSNGSAGDESSFDKYDNEFVDGNFSNSELMSPPRHSWEDFNRYVSPYSSICREAKKRLSERRATVASNGSNLDQRRFGKSSSTLGEMLALADMKKSEILKEKDNYMERNRRRSASCVNSDVGLKGGNNSPENLLRAKSVPVSSSYGERLNVEPSNAILSRNGSRELMKVKTSKSSFAGRVTSLFFPSRKTRKDKRDGRFGQGISSDQGGYYVPDTTTLEIHGENQDQPSPISVLEPPFEEDKSSKPGCSSSMDPNPYGKSSLIDKSPPIGSIARTLSWEESCILTTNSYPSNSPSTSPKSEDDEGEILSLVQSLLSMAGLDDVEQLTNMTEWRSPGSPLDPLLKGKYVDLSAKEPLPESRRRQLRSRRKLIFDCVNAALVDISGVGTTSGEWTRGCVGLRTHKALLETVWARIKEWYEGRVKFRSLDDGDGDSLVERVVIEEVVGKGWALLMGFEVDNIGEEIEEKLLEQLVEEYLVDWTR